MIFPAIDHSWGIFQPATFDYQGYILDTCLNSIWISDHLSHLSLIYIAMVSGSNLFWPPKQQQLMFILVFTIHPLGVSINWNHPFLWQVFYVSAYNGLFSGWIFNLEIQWIWRCAYPLVMTNIAIENGHRNSGFTHEKLWFSIAMLNYQRVILHCSRVKSAFNLLVKLLLFIANALCFEASTSIQPTCFSPFFPAQWSLRPTHIHGRVFRPGTR